MVRRIIKKAELLDAGVLQAMIEDGKLKTRSRRKKTVELLYLARLRTAFPRGHSSNVAGSVSHYKVGSRDDDGWVALRWRLGRRDGRVAVPPAVCVAALALRRLRRGGWRASSSMCSLLLHTLGQ